jgi:hypothetical protein
MITMLKDWQGKVEVNGDEYETITTAISQNKGLNGQVHIKLYPLTKNASVGQNRVAVAGVDNASEVKITVKAYMTKKATPDFDFMARWNDNNPMPLRIMQGVKVKETNGMVYMKLHAQAEETITCLRCGRELTNPVSRKYGIGPECITKIPVLIKVDVNDVDDVKAKMVDITWEGWIIKSSILSEESV